MALNKILPFADTASGGNILTDAAYESDAQRNIGHQPGIARQELANKQARQTSIISAGVAQFLADNQAIDVVDTLTPEQISTMLSSSVVKYYTTTPTSNVGLSIYVENIGYMHWDGVSVYAPDWVEFETPSFGYIRRWRHDQGYYETEQWVIVDKPTTVSPLVVNYPIAFSLGAKYATATFLGQNNLNSPVSVGNLGTNSCEIWTTAGGISVLLRIVGR